MKAPSFDFSQELKKLKSSPPGSVYVLYGPEDYLLDRYVETLKSLCVENETFSYYPFDGMPSPEELRQSVSTVPFLSPHSFVEIRSCDVNKLTEEYTEILSDVPDFCTVALICPPDYSLDNRTKTVKFLKSHANVLEFTEQEDSKLYPWMRRRVEAGGHTISRQAADRLLFLCGRTMSAIIPELDKAAAYASGEEIGIADVNAVATPLPEAEAFDLVELLSQKKFDGAVSMLAELLNVKKMEPVVVISAFAYQFRQLYGAKLGNLDDKQDYRSTLTKRTASAFSKETLRNCIRICLDTEYALKTSAMSDADLLKNMLVKLILEVGKFGDSGIR